MRSHGTCTECGTDWAANIDEAKESTASHSPESRVLTGTDTIPQYVLSRPMAAGTVADLTIPARVRVNVHSPSATVPGTIPDACTTPSRTSSVMMVSDPPDACEGVGDATAVGTTGDGSAVGDGDAVGVSADVPDGIAPVSEGERLAPVLQEVSADTSASPITTVDTRAPIE